MRTTSATLFDSGYRLILNGRDEKSLLIVKPDETKYLLRPYESRCSCAGYSHRGYCKHIAGWWELLQQTADEHATRGDLSAAFALMTFRFAYLRGASQ